MVDLPQPAPPQAPPDERPKRVRGCLAIMLAGLVLLGGLTIAAVLSGPHTLAFVLLLGGTFGLIVLHYAVWGWWLGPRIRDEARRNEPPDE